MTTPPPDGAPQLNGPAPSYPDNVNAPGAAFLPPQGPNDANRRPDYWATPPQPQAPGWPYTGVLPYGNVPPLPPYSAQPPPTDGIGPERVPWGFWDVVIAAIPLLLSFALVVVVHFLPSSTGTPASETPTSTRLLVANTVVGLVIYGVILLLIWLVTVRKYHVGWSSLGVRRPPGLYFALVIPILVGMYVAATLVSLVIVKLFYGGKAENPQVKDLTGGGGFSWTRLILALITASIAAPIIEELLFRGVLYGWLRTRWSAVGGVILSAAIFSAAHAIPLILASIFVVGLTLAIVYEKTKSTIATMTLHSLFNTIGVIAVFIDLARK
ncbi:MAG: CPBP family glutamic-type intramembrane protease [Chloroflexota bacterium]|nr:CPBP family glutamic-type intramembrane protease [Chloroflexota bacterium]